jgi:hypothetical protein
MKRRLMMKAKRIDWSSHDTWQKYSNMQYTAGLRQAIDIMMNKSVFVESVNSVYV